MLDPAARIAGSPLLPGAVLSVGGAALWGVLRSISDATSEDMSAAWARHGFVAMPPSAMRASLTVFLSMSRATAAEASANS